jgi:hypothetical protein
MRLSEILDPALRDQIRAVRPVSPMDPPEKANRRSHNAAQQVSLKTNAQR